MSVFDGEIEYRSVYMVDYIKKDKPKSPRIRSSKDDKCLLIGLERNSLKTREAHKKTPDVVCPQGLEYYKRALDRLKKECPKLVKKHKLEDVDIIPVENEIKDLKRTEYLYRYCPRDLPFMSVNLTRRARALQTLHLPDDVFIPDTTYLGSYRKPSDDKFAEHPMHMSMKPKPDFSLRKELRRILRITTGDTSYDLNHGLLAKVVLEKNPFGPPREEPKYGRWKNPYYYTYRIN